MALIEYKPGTTFPGNIGLTIDQSSPAWPEPLRAKEGTPNVLFIVLDDTGYVQFENGFLSEILLQQGYNTYMVGKYHLIPSELESAAGPYDRWPLGRGFERFYGFMGGDTHQYYPEFIYD